MIPPSSKNFLVNNLAAGTPYDLCVLAIYDDVITSLTATRVVGCVQFTTESEYMRCHFMQSQVLGGTMIIIIGGIIVASVLIFIIILMIRYKVSGRKWAELCSFGLVFLIDAAHYGETLKLTPQNYPLISMMQLRLTGGGCFPGL